MKTMSILNQRFLSQAIDIDDIDYTPINPSDNLVTSINLLEGNVIPAILIRNGLRFTAIANINQITACSINGFDTVNAIVCSSDEIAKSVLTQINS
jgi:hypothetical protein